MTGWPDGPLEVTVSFRVEQLREEALRVAPEDRARLATELFNSLDALDEVDHAPVDAANRLDVGSHGPQVAGTLHGSNVSSLAPDATHSGSETRWAAWGRTFEGRELAIVFTLRSDRIRPISARDMSRKERQRYAEAETKDQGDP
jgi:uncharacterized DUF497 family protein